MIVTVHPWAIAQGCSGSRTHNREGLDRINTIHPGSFAMTQTNDLPRRVTRLENDNIDLKVAVSALIESVNLHQSNFEINQRNLERMQANFEQKFERMEARFEAMQTEIRGIQMENRRLIEQVFHDPDADANPGAE
jgi:predicted  nucleic acid-binding Zn-ribbon protein